MAQFEFAIIGAGIAGASAAAALAPLGRVLLIEAESTPGYHSTGRSVAILSQTYGSSQVRALTAASRALLEAPPRDFAGGPPLLRPRGLMFVAKPGDEPRLAGHAAKAASLNVAIDTLSADQVSAKVPALIPREVAGGVLEPGASDIDVAALHGGYLRAAKHAGAQVLVNAPLRAAERLGGLWRITAGDAQFDAARIVNAAGAWADRVATMAGVAPLGLMPLARTVVTFDAPPDIDPAAWPMVMAADHAFYFKPDAGRILASLSDEQPSVACDVQPEELHIAELMDRLGRSTVFDPRRLASRWAGLRTFAPDRDLVCGPDPAEPSFFWLAGQGGFGIQTAPAVAELVAALAGDQVLPIRLAEAGVDPDALSPDRAALRDREPHPRME